MDEFEDLSKVRHVQHQDPVAARVTSQPTRALELRLAQLEERFSAFSQSGEFGNLVIHNVPVKTGDMAVAENDVVFFNSNTGLYEKAQAGVTFSADNYISNPSALAIGICVAVNGGVGDIMVAGYAPMTDDRKENMPESIETFQPGAYYLSEHEAGKITRYAPALRIQVLVATGSHFILTPAYSSPEGLEVLYRVSPGMRPVGGVRALPPSFEQQVIVGFDALELYDETATLNQYRLTADSDIEEIAQFGYLIADAEVTTQPDSPRYLKIHVEKGPGGAVTIYQADTLEGLSSALGIAQTALAPTTNLNERTFTVTDAADAALGTLFYKFVSDDRTYARDVYLKFPDSFQGWKMVNPPIVPTATALVGGGLVTDVVMNEGGIGYATAPIVVFTPTNGGNGAAGHAILNDYGSITSVVMDAAGTGYVDPPKVIFDTQVEAVRVENGGSGALLVVSLSGAAIGSIAVSNGGVNYWSTPAIIITDPTGEGAIAEAEIVNGAISRINIVNAGSGYTDPKAYVHPNGNYGYQLGSVDLAFVGGSTLTPADGDVYLSESSVERVEVQAGGYAYDPITTTLTLPTGGATFKAEFDSNGTIIAVRVLTPGSGYDGPQTLLVGTPGNGNGFRANVVIGSFVTAVVVSDPGADYQSNPTAAVAVPVARIDVEEGGSEYLIDPPPAVTLSVQDNAATPATAVARVGGCLRQLAIEDPGTGYHHATTTATVGGDGTGAEIQLAFNVAGEIVSADIINPGWGYTSAPLITIIDTDPGTPGSGGDVTTVIEGQGSVVAIELTANGSAGYIQRPTVTIDPPSSGTTARATAKLMGERATLTPGLAGDGGIRRLTVPDEFDFEHGNALQARDYHDDLDDQGTAFIKPNGAAYYYNIKADPTLAGKWPANPIDKAILSLNGVDLGSTTMSETNGDLVDPNADVVFNRKTILWTTLDADGCPWDREFRQYILDVGSTGSDHIIQDSGPFGYEDGWWRYWEHVFRYEPYRNIAQLNVNRASRFYQSNRISAIGVLSPLKMVDVITGNDLPSDGTLATGQVVIRVDNQASLFGGTLESIPANIVNSIVAIFQNKTGRPVMISSIILTVAHQTQPSGTVPMVSDAAKITVGTQAGNYRDIVGTVDPTQVTQRGVSTCLYGVNQVKELFPDTRESAPLIMPNVIVYARVDDPVHTITTQRIVARIKGHVL